MSIWCGNVRKTVRRRKGWRFVKPDQNGLPLWTRLNKLNTKYNALHVTCEYTMPPSQTHPCMHTCTHTCTGTYANMHTCMHTHTHPHTEAWTMHDYIFYSPTPTPKTITHNEISTLLTANTYSFKGCGEGLCELPASGGRVAQHETRQDPDDTCCSVCSHSVVDLSK